MVNLGISPKYFLDEMSIDEISAILKTREEIKREEWEKVRFQCFYSVVAINGSNTYKKPSDLFRFPWEARKKRKRGRKYTSEEVKRKEKSVQRYLGKINGKRIQCRI